MRQKNIANMQSRPATHHAAANWEDRDRARLKMFADRSLAPCCSALRMARQAFSVAQETATASSLDRCWEPSDSRPGVSSRCRWESMAHRRQSEGRATDRSPRGGAIGALDAQSQRHRPRLLVRFVRIGRHKPGANDPISSSHSQKSLLARPMQLDNRGQRACPR